MKKVLITFAEKPIKNYPLAVVVIDPDNKHWPDGRGQDYLVRSVRDGMILGNGICAGARIAIPFNHDWPVNPELDERLKLPDGKLE